MSVPSLTSRIDSVMVFRRGAEVIRVATLDDGDALPDRVRLDGLPLCLDDHSLEVQVSGDGGPLPRATDVQVTLGVTAADPALPPPDDEELRAARQAVIVLQDRLQQVEEQRERLDEIPDVERPEGAEGQPPPPSPIRARRALLAFRHEEMEALDGRLGTLRGELREAAKVRDDLAARKRSSARQARPHELRKGATVALQWPDGVPGGPVRFALRYRVPGACWAPAYSVVLDPSLTRAELSVRAVVAQRSGEDWSGVPLTVSTAAIQRWVELPELQALRIGRRQPAPPSTGWRPAPVGADALFEDYDRVRVAAPVGGAYPEEPEAELDDIDDDWEEAEAYEPEPDLMMDEMRSELPEEKEYAKQDMAPPAPMAPASAPAPQAAMRARMAPKKKAKPMASRAAAAFGAMAGAVAANELPGGGGAPPPPAPLGASDDQLAYGQLRMPGPGDGGRGKLVRVRQRARVLELIRLVDVEVEFDAVEVIERAASDASGAGSAGLPPRHIAPRPWEGFDAVYRADDAVDVPSDGQFHAVPLLVREGEVHSRHVVVPREATDVFRVAELHNPLPWPLLQGPAEVYVGADYLLTTELPASPPRGEVRLGLGVDQAVKVARNTTFEEESAGLIKGSLRLQHGIAIEVANRRATPIELEVRERIPTVRDKEEDIEVTMGSVEPPWEAWEPEDHELRGGHRWRLTLKPGEERTLRAGYTVKIAAKNELAGGNRREV